LGEGLGQDSRGQIRLFQFEAQINGNGWVSNQWQHLSAERHLIPPNNPTDEHSSESVESHEGGVNRPFMLDPTGVENDETWNALQGDQGTCGHLPRIVTWIQPWRSDWIESSRSAGSSSCCLWCFRSGSHYRRRSHGDGGGDEG